MTDFIYAPRQGGETPLSRSTRLWGEKEEAARKWLVHDMGCRECEPGAPCEEMRRLDAEVERAADAYRDAWRAMGGC